MFICISNEFAKNEVYTSAYIFVKRQQQQYDNPLYLKAVALWILDFDYV